MRHRSSEIRVHDHLYTIVNGERGEFYFLCVYCGQPASDRDHIPPISRVDDYRSLKLANEVYIKVPSCSECNRMASNVLNESFLERAEYIKDKIAKKYKLKKNSIEWDDDELNELDYSLRSKVLEKGKIIKLARERVNYYEGIDLVLEYVDL